jgi:hypothetical protein
LDSYFKFCLIKKKDDSSLKSCFKYFTNSIYLYNSEYLVLLAENLAYFHQQQQLAKNENEIQFNLIDNIRISDIVYLVNH